MKPFLLALSLFICGIANATNYYFSSVSGDDSRTTAQAQNPATPWKTLSKLNSFFGSLVAGDSVLLKRGETFYGSLAISKSGTVGRSINIGSYGTGARPIISGFTTVAGWTDLGSNIWESSSAVSTLSSVNMLVINGKNTAMGRYPNTGYLKYQSSSPASITSSSLTGSPNWAGAEAVIRMYRWVIDRCPITSQSGGTLNFDDNDGDYDPTNNYGFFIQNDVRTLDAQNEWYFNPTTKKVRIYSTSAPVNVQVASVSTLATISAKNYITFDNLSFQGANDKAIYCNGGNTVTIQYCDILYSGGDAVYSYPNAPNIKVQYCNINNSNNSGVNLGNSDAGIIQHNTINNTGLFPGMGGYVNSNFTAALCKGDFSDISYNHIDTAGYNGIYFAGNGSNVKYNYVNYVCFNKDDGGAIYCYPLQGVGQTYTSKRTVQGNICLNSIGALEAATGSQSNGHLIYNDGADDNTDYLDNTMAHTAYGGFGLFFNNARNSTVRNNTIYDCWKGFYYIKYTAIDMDNNKIVNNKFVARIAGDYAAYYEPDETNMTASTILDSNLYARPIDDNKTVWYGVNASNVYYTLAEWKSFTGRESHSMKSSITASSVNDIRFVYNETSTNLTINLVANYKDVKGISYPGTITLAPFTSAVLVKNDVINVPPIANAGSDQAISLPVTITLPGSGSYDPDGTIASYAWTKVSGPTTVTITNATSQTASVIGLAIGTYKFELKVTDNKGAVGRDTTTVNFGTIIVPVTLIEFSATAKPGKTTLLRWKTATEINSDYFMVERSTDGVNFTQVAIVNANDNSNSVISYQMTDNFPENGINYYRLKMVDNDSRFQYSNIVSVNFKTGMNGTVSVESTGTYRDRFEISVNSTKDQSASYGIYDATGRMLYMSNILLQTGLNGITKNMMLPDAVYYFKLQTSEEKVSLPLINRNN